MCKRRRGVCFRTALCVLAIFLSPQISRAQESRHIVGDTFEKTEGSGLYIRTAPAGVRVFIDGVERGQTPLLISTLRSGVYRVRLVRDGYVERMFRITLSDRSRMLVSIEMQALKGQVLVNVSRAEESPPDLPFNPLIDGGGGESAETLLLLPPGQRTIRVRAFGWETVDETVYVSEDIPLTVNVTLNPARFMLSGGSLSRRNFNPANSGALGETSFYFTVSAPGSGTLSIYDQSGAEVYTESVGPFETWSQKVSWNGRDRSGAVLPEGRYRAVITAEALSGDSENAQQELELYAQIDYSLAIYPLAFAGGISGLLFAPLPATLPAGSFQINGLFLFGNFSVPEKTAAEQSDKSFSSFPLEIGFRISALNRLEFGGSFALNALREGEAGAGFTLSAKYAFFSGNSGSVSDFPLGLAAGLSYTYANANGEFPSGEGRGLGLYLPLSLNIGPVKVLFSAATRWPGIDDPIPRLMLSTGALFQGAWYTIGLSLREEFDFTNSGSRAGIPFQERLRFHGGLEFNIYPPPSYLVYTLAGGVWLHGSRLGGFGGLGIGFLY